MTDIIPVITDANGRNVLRFDYPMDNIRVKINIGGLDFTNEPIPIKALTTNYENRELQSGFVLPPNQKFGFVFDAKYLPNNPPVGLMDYPLLVSITLKAYEIPKYLENFKE